MSCTVMNEVIEDYESWKLESKYENIINDSQLYAILLDCIGQKNHDYSSYFIKKFYDKLPCFDQDFISNITEMQKIHDGKMTNNVINKNIEYYSIKNNVIYCGVIIDSKQINKSKFVFKILWNNNVSPKNEELNVINDDNNIKWIDLNKMLKDKTVRVFDYIPTMTINIAGEVQYLFCTKLREYLDLSLRMNLYVKYNNT